MLSCGCLGLTRRFVTCGLQLLRRIDHGEAVQISGISDAALCEQLAELFGHLHLRKTLQARSQPRSAALHGCASSPSTFLPALWTNGCCTGSADYCCFGLSLLSCDC